MGLLRDRILAQTFGASVSLDAYNAAFIIPDLLFNVLVASGIAAAAVPLFTSLYRKNSTHAYNYMNTVTTAAIGVTVMSALLLLVLAPVFTSFVAPGLDAAGEELVVSLMRIVAFSPILFAASNALGAMLVARQRFFWYGVSPIMYNVGIIGGALLLAPSLGIVGVAYGAVAGAALHLIVRAFDAFRSGWRPAIRWHWHMPEMRQTVKLMIPKMVGHPVELLTFSVFTSLASHLASGSITVLNFARNFQSVPVSLLGIAMATAVFPTLAEAADSSRSELKKIFNRTAGTILIASSIAALVTFIIRRPLVSILLGGGEFGEAAVARTALTLSIFCLSIPTESLSHLFARAFYATKNTITPVIFSVISLLIAGGSSYMLLERMDILALPIGFFLGSFVKSAGLYLLFLTQSNRRIV